MISIFGIIPLFCFNKVDFTNVAGWYEVAIQDGRSSSKSHNNFMWLHTKQAGCKNNNTYTIRQKKNIKYFRIQQVKLKEH